MLLILLISVLCETRLVAVVEICRHGARSPTTFQPWDNYDLWPQGPGELLPEGMRQQYLLGLELRRRYTNVTQILMPNYFQPEIFVFTDDVDRTIMSAQSQIQGIYPEGFGPLLRSIAMETVAVPPINVTAEEALIEALGLSALPNLTQVIPIHSDSQSRQYAIAPGASCSYYSQLTGYKMTLPGLQAIFDLYPDVITAYMQTLGISKMQAQQRTEAITDSLVCNAFMGYPLPPLITDTVLQRAQILAMQVKSFNLFQPDLLARLAGTSLMEDVLTDLQVAMNMTSPARFYLYSGHDTTVSFTLAFLQLNYSIPPEYASTLLFELNQYSNGFFVTLKYNDVYQAIPTCGGFNCSFANFQRYIEFRSVPNITGVCGYSMSGTPTGNLSEAISHEFYMAGKNDDYVLHWYFWVAVGVYAAVAVLLIIMSRFCCLRKNRLSLTSAETSMAFKTT